MQTGKGPILPLRHPGFGGAFFFRGLVRRLNPDTRRKVKLPSLPMYTGGLAQPLFIALQCDQPQEGVASLGVREGLMEK